MRMIRQVIAVKTADRMLFNDHLSELRMRFIRIIITGAIGFTLIYLIRDRIFEYILKVAEDLGYSFIYISPQEVFITELKASLCGAAIVIFPAVVIELTGFILPAIEREIRRSRIYVMYMAGQGLFMLGIAFAYFVLLPLVMKFLYLYSENSFAQSSISIEKYISFVMSIILAIAFVFELPLVNVILSRLGVLTSDILRKLRPGVIIAIFVIAALITPPDVVSQILVAVPMMCLYELSIMICGRTMT